MKTALRDSWERNRFASLRQSPGLGVQLLPAHQVTSAQFPHLKNGNNNADCLFVGYNDICDQHCWQLWAESEGITSPVFLGDKCVGQDSIRDGTTLVSP